MAPSSPRAEVWDLMVADTDFLECGICFLPLKPPIFQCAVGHVVCSPCLEKLKVNDAAGKCHVCDVAMAGGYQRCHAMERAVDAVRAACPHAPYGCGARPAYHAREDHLRACHCPGEACGFVGSTAALLDHVSGAHGWPVHTQHPGLLGTVAAVCLRDGFNFVVVADEHGHGRREHLVLLNVARHPFWRAVSVVCVCPRSAAAKEMRAVVVEDGPPPPSARSRVLLRSDPLVRRERRTEFRVACSDLSDGLPDPNGRCQFIVPIPRLVHGYDDANTMVAFRINVTDSSSHQ